MAVAVHDQNIHLFVGDGRLKTGVKYPVRVALVDEPPDDFERLVGLKLADKPAGKYISKV